MRKSTSASLAFFFASNSFSLGCGTGTGAASKRFFSARGLRSAASCSCDYLMLK
jgi:hypothetical protein